MTFSDASCSGPKTGLQQAAALALVSEPGAQRSQVRVVSSFGTQPRGFSAHGARMGRERRPTPAAASCCRRSRRVGSAGTPHSQQVVCGGAPMAGVDPRAVSLRACGWTLTVRWQDVVVEAGPLAEAPGLTPSLLLLPAAAPAWPGGEGGVGGDGGCLSAL